MGVSAIARFGSCVLFIVLGCAAGRAATTVFFSPAQTVSLVATNASSDTISSQGYLFTYTRDKLYTGGTTNVIGRQVRVSWPDGLEAQYVTTINKKASITVRRADGGVFDLTEFTARLLANAGAGRAIEIVPLLKGEEPLNDPLYFDVSGNYGNEFHYDTSPNYLGSTAALTNYDAYVIGLTLDYALLSITLVDPSLAPPLLTLSQANGWIEISWPADASDYSLESAPQLAATTWEAVTNAVMINGNSCSVQLEAAESAQMYRLSK